MADLQSWRHENLVALAHELNADNQRLMAEATELRKEIDDLRAERKELLTQLRKEWTK